MGVFTFGGVCVEGMHGEDADADPPDYNGMSTKDAVHMMNSRGLVVYEGCTVVVDAPTGKAVMIFPGSMPDAALVEGTSDGLDFMLMNPDEGHAH